MSPDITPLTMIQPISIKLLSPENAEPDQSSLLVQQFATIMDTINAAYQQRIVGDISVASDIGEFLDLMVSLDHKYGADAALPLVDINEVVDDALRAMAELCPWLTRTTLKIDITAVDDIILGIGLWAMRHDCPINMVAPIVNALAERANAATTRQDTAAVYALMQGFIAWLAPQLEADLERSNPERPWRLLNLNFAITAIRTADEAMMRYAFATLKQYLADECAGFYQEALTLAMQPGFPPQTRQIIEAESMRFAAQNTQVH